MTKEKDEINKMNFDVAHKSLNRFCNGEARMCIPVQDNDDDMILSSTLDNAEKEIIKLKSQIAVLKEACEFYGLQLNWNNYGGATPVTDIGQKDQENFGGNMFFGGKKAREALERYEALEKK